MAKILIVDDEPDLLNVLSMLVSAQGHVTKKVAKSDLVEQILVSESFDLMLSDLRMLPLSGLDLLRIAKEHHPQMPVVIITAYNSDATVKECIAAGAEDVIPKPFDFEQLMKVVGKALDRKTPC